MELDNQERRTSERQLVGTTLWIAGSRIGEYEPLSVNDVSLGGLSFRSDVRWFEGDAVRVYVNVDGPLFLKGEVIRCTRRGHRFGGLPMALFGRLYDVAVSFVDEAPAHRREVVAQIFLTEVYHRGLYG